MTKAIDQLHSEMIAAQQAYADTLDSLDQELFRSRQQAFRTAKAAYEAANTKPKSRRNHR